MTSAEFFNDLTVLSTIVHRQSIFVHLRFIDKLAKKLYNNINEFIQNMEEQTNKI